MPRGEKERALYEPVKKALLECLSLDLGNCVLQDTSAEIPEGLKPFLDDHALFYIERDLQRPDLFGWFQSYTGTKGLIIVEIKRRLQKVDSIYQAKKYAEVFNAEYAFLISAEKLPERMKRLLIKRQVICTFSINKELVVARFNVENGEFEVEKELYGGVLPDPFKTAYKPAAYFSDPKASRENIVGPRIITRGKKAYEMAGWVDDLVKNGSIPFGRFDGVDLKEWAAKNNYQMIQRPPTKEELGM
jgi:hypothetical protein